MKVYTKTGDDGTTSLIGGKRVKKNHIRIETYGTIDELISYIGLLRTYQLTTEIHDFLFASQQNLMLISAHIANEDKKITLKNIDNQTIIEIEKLIDSVSENLPRLVSFVIPGGSEVNANCNIARTICRKAERKLIALNEKTKIDKLHIQYLNRLSDFLFVLGRFSLISNGEKEIYWKG